LRFRLNPREVSEVIVCHWTRLQLLNAEAQNSVVAFGAAIAVLLPQIAYGVFVKKHHVIALWCNGYFITLH